MQKNMKILICLFTILAIVSCKKPTKETVPNTSTASIVGTWKTTSMYGKFYENNVLTIDTTLYAPYYGEVDIIETIRFTTDSLYIKMNNEITEGEFYKYQKSGNYILTIDSTSTDTLLFLNNLTSTNFDFTLDYEQYYVGANDSLFLGRIVSFYKSLKQ